MTFRRSFGIAFLLVSCCILREACGETFRVATYNLKGYMDKPIGPRPAKSSMAKDCIAQIIKDVRPDVLAVQEIGGFSALLHLKDSLKEEGLAFPHYEIVAGYDTNIFVAVLSRFPFQGSHPHTNGVYLLGGRRLRVQRGFAEVQIQPASNYTFTLFVAHLKSRLAYAMGDEAEMRLQEAMLLRELIDERLSANPEANIIVAGDLNDLRSSRPVRILVGRGKNRLMDCRPSEAGISPEGKVLLREEALPVNWTHYFATDDTYSRVDYILLSQGMAREVIPPETFVYGAPNWGCASDHRPVAATFEAVEK